MNKEKLLVVANWKMNPQTVEKAKEIFLEIKKIAKNLKRTRVIVCPPFVYLSTLEKINSSDIILGAQDVFWEESGSFTGEISPKMLKGESYVIIGHSERRDLGETNEIVSKKLLSATLAGLKPILCIGERDRDAHGEYLHFLRGEIINSLGKFPRKFLKKLIIAYEPVWAIGKGEEGAMKPSDVHETSLYIKKVLAEVYGPKEAILVPILYGGSVSHDNVKDLITLGEVQGVLVGRESLNVKKFGELLKNVDQF